MELATRYCLFRYTIQFYSPEVGQILEVGVRSLNIDVSRDFFEGAEYFKSVRMHGGVAGSKTKVMEHLLEANEAVVQDGDGTINDGAALKASDVSRMYAAVRLHPLAGLGTRPVARYTLALDRLFLRRATSHARTVVFK